MAGKERCSLSIPFGVCKESISTSNVLIVLIVRTNLYHGLCYSDPKCGECLVSFKLK